MNKKTRKPFKLMLLGIIGGVVVALLQAVFVTFSHTIWSESIHARLTSTAPVNSIYELITGPVMTGLEVAEVIFVVIILVGFVGVIKNVLKKDAADEEETKEKE